MLLKSHQKVENLQRYKQHGAEIFELGLDRIEAHLDLIGAADEVYDRAFNVSLQFIRNKSASNLGWCKYTWDREKFDETLNKDDLVALSSHITINWGHKHFHGKLTEIKDTVLHELAHHLAVVLHGHHGANHGPLWKSCAIILGANPSATAR